MENMQAEGGFEPEYVELYKDVAQALAESQAGEYTMQQVERFEKLGTPVVRLETVEDVIEAALDPSNETVTDAERFLAGELKKALDPTLPYQTPSASYEVRVRQLLSAALNLTQGDARFNSAKQYIAEALNVCPPA